MSTSYETRERKTEDRPLPRTEWMSQGLIQISRELAGSLADLPIPDGCAYVYNPLEYARETHEKYLKRYGLRPKEILLVGMNPGPWGMAQTGVPFGEVKIVRGWLGIEGRVKKPAFLHPNRPVDGLSCQRSEVSGKRLWGWAKTRFSDPETFFSTYFVTNYCPLLFYDKGGRNITPDRLPKSERDRLFPICDEALKEVVQYLRPRWVLGVGRFAADRAVESLAGIRVRIGRITHPSPANPRANRGWEAVIETELTLLGIDIP